MHNGCKGRTTWGKNFLLRAGGGDEYTCRDCGGDGPTLVERERPRVLAEALVKSSQLPATSSGRASLENISATSNSLGNSSIASSGKGREESDAKSGFFASKEEMLSLLAGIVERSKREEMEDEQADPVRNETDFASEPEIGEKGRTDEPGSIDNNTGRETRV